MYKGITVGAITTIGNKHVNRGTPCEDASYAVAKNGVSVVCIADGAGGKQYTDARFGSDCAVHVITDTLCEHFDALYSENREAAVRGYLMAKLRVAFADIMEERTIDVIDRLSCTLLFVAVKDRRMMIGHIGDGLIVRVSPSGLSPVSMPQNDKDGKTYFVTAAHADNYMRLLKTTVDDVHAIALMTDGVQDSVYNEDSGLVKPVVAKMVEAFSDGREEGEKSVLETVQKYIVGSSNVSDDASAADELKPLLEKAHEIEKRGDEVNHIIRTNVSTDFITPIERGDILELAIDLDDITDMLEGVLQRFYMFDVHFMHPHAIEFAMIIKKSLKALRKSMDSFRDFKKLKKIRAMVEDVNELEEQADELYREAIRKLYAEESDDAVRVEVWSRLFDRLEATCDACKTVAETMSIIVLKNV